MERARLGAAAARALLVAVVACGHHEAPPETPIAPPAGTITWPFRSSAQEAGAVRAIAIGADGTIYVGGTFTRVGPMTGAGVPVSATDGAALAGFARIGGTGALDGMVYAAAADGAGGWYVGGKFASVGGEARANLAHVLADGSVDPAWNPGASFASPATPEATGYVVALAFDGTTLYVAGYFDTLAGVARASIGAVDAAGAVTAWAPAIVPTGDIDALALRGTTVYVGGSFATADGQPRSGLAAYDASGALLDWDPGVGGTGTVYRLLVLGDAVYAAGSFEQLGGQPRAGVGAVDAVTGAVTGWDPAFQRAAGLPVVRGFAADAGTLYVGGVFDVVDGEARPGLAAFDASGALTAWAPAVDPPYVTALAASGGVVYAHGLFRRAGGLARSRLAAFDASGGATAWDPDLEDQGWAIVLAPSGGAVYVGGEYRWIGKATKRSGLAAIDPAGAVKAWNPGVEGATTPGLNEAGFGGAVHALAVVGDTVYVGGEFSKVGGAARANLAAVDAAGNVTAWIASAAGPVFALAWAGDALYAGGRFQSVANQARANLAAIDASGRLTSWNPGANALVTSLAASGTTIYAGGYFTAVAGQRRTALAAVDLSGALLPWDPQPSDAFGWASPAGMIGPPPGAWSLAVDGGKVYVVGDFQKIGGLARKNVAAVDAASGVPTRFVNPNVGGLVRVVGVVQGEPAEGGTLDTRFFYGTKAATGVAIVDPGSTEGSAGWAQILPMESDYDKPEPSVQALAAKDGVLYMGGLFRGLPGTEWTRWNLAAHQDGQLTTWNPSPLP